MKEPVVFTSRFRDSFSEGAIYPSRAIAAIGLLVVLSVFLSYI